MAKRRSAASPLADLGLSVDDVLADYRLGWRSRHASLIGRREVMAGKAKFGIFGDGKEVAQLAMARAWRKGDWRSGYYRDQTLIFALGIHSVQEFFAQLYAHADEVAEPASGGRGMDAHFGSRLLDDAGRWLPQTDRYNTSSDVSPTGTQMPRLVGLAYASRLYRELEGLREMTGFSRNGQEVAWGTIGNATCAEGLFWESVDAIGVLRCPAIICIWDDGYGISVPNEVQHTKGDVGQLLEGFRRAPGSRDGFDIHRVKGWDYPALLAAFGQAAATARAEQLPAIIHVVDLGQPQGHSTSGSHERYKSKDRLAWEAEYDGLRQMRLWILAAGLATEAQLDAIDREERLEVEARREAAWEAFSVPQRAERDELLDILAEVAATPQARADLDPLVAELRAVEDPSREQLLSGLRKAQVALYRHQLPEKDLLARWKAAQLAANRERYGSHLYSRSAESPLLEAGVPPRYAADAPELNGFDVVNAAFDAILGRDPRVVAFGEDLGRIGDVNQGFRGLQEKYGPLRVADTGIREATILGQAIGLAMRGLRPIAEIQYLDYVLYALQIMSDDLATLHWRSKGGQKAPVIVRTRGHRLEGIWHSGSPMAGILNLVQGIHVLVPRDLTRAAGFYNTLLAGDDPGLVVEVLSGYRLKERLPENIAEMRLPLGVPEILRAGTDLTLVTYGACCRIAATACEVLAGLGVDVELIDVQSLLPFDLPGLICDSVAKTGRVIFLDEDVPGGTTAYMMREVIERQGVFQHLDSPPRTLSAEAHRPAYGSDGDYFSKPNVESIIDAVLDLMNESDPTGHPLL
ncbi:MAG: transketolase [Ardenticatenia bacterium]|nr:transketolase [Ardenticatenia bacterium]